MEIQGKYNCAKIFTDRIDEKAVSQLRAVCDSPIFENAKIRIMPDVHAGAGCTIGTTMTISDKIVPDMVGVDIGCGMELVELKERKIDLKELDSLIYERIPAGMNSRKSVHAYAESIDLSRLKCLSHVNTHLAYHSIGTLGGGNHFIEANTDEEGRIYLVVHSGSRHLGVEVAEYYQNEGYRELCGCSVNRIRELISRLKAEGRRSEIETEVKRAKGKECGIPRELAYVSGKLFDDYLADMKLVQQFAALNRKTIVNEIVSGMGLTVTDGFTTIHNYIDTENMILRKGAVSARRGEKLLIPINMRDGSLICVGRGNADWNFSAPHGAGRVMSRSQAFSRLTVEDFKREMSGIYTTSVGQSTLDESPMAYKSLEDIEKNIAPTAEIVKRIVPIYNFKAGEHTLRKKGLAEK